VLPLAVDAQRPRFFAAPVRAMSKRKFPPTPKGLAPGGLILWRAVVRTGELRPDSVRILEDACRTADMIDDLEEYLTDQPRTVKGSQGQEVIHPIISELRQHRSVLNTLLRGLDLPRVDASGAEAAQDAREAAISLARARWGTK